MKKLFKAKVPKPTKVSGAPKITNALMKPEKVKVEPLPKPASIKKPRKR